MAVEKTQLIAQIAQANGVSLNEAKKLCEGKTQSQLESMLSSALSGKVPEYTTEFEHTIEKPVQSHAPAQSIPKLTEAQTKDLTITFLSQNIQDAIETVSSVDNGLVSKGYDKLKNLFDTRTSSSNVDRVLNNEITSLDFLVQANDGALTKKEYYTQNRERLKQIMLERLQSKDEKTGLDYLDKFASKSKDKEKLLKLISEEIDNKIALIEQQGGIDTLKQVQRQMMLADESVLAPELDKLIKNTLKNNSAGIEGQNINFKMSIKFPEIKDAEKSMKFEEVFQIERGVEYNKKSVERFQQSKNEMIVATAAFNKVQSFKNSSKELIDKEKTSDDVVKLFEDYYHIDKNLAKENLEKLIKKQNLDISVKQNEQGQTTLEFGERYKDEKAKNRVLNSLLLAGNNAQDEKLKQVLGDKTLEEYANSYQSNYQFAFGAHNAQDLATAMKQDNQTIIDTTTQFATYGGMGLMVVGGVLTLTPLAPLGAGMASIGGKVALTGIAAKNIAGLTEAYTRDNINDEEITRRYKDLALDVGGLLIGGAAGRQGLKIATNMVNKGSSALVATLAEKGVDFTLSAIGDLAMMGAMGDDLSNVWAQNGMGIMVSTLTGIQTSKTLFKQATHAAKIDMNPFKPVNTELPTKQIEAKISEHNSFQFQNTSAIDNLKDIALESSNTRSKFFATPEIQTEIGATLDNFLNTLKKSSKQKNTNSQIKPYQTVMFDDGSCIYLDNSKGKDILFYITDSNGNGRNIAATNFENITKAKLLIEQSHQGIIINRNDIPIIQEKIKATGKPASQIIFEMNEVEKTKRQLETNEFFAKNQSFPDADKILTMASPEVEAIKLTNSEKIKGKIKGDDEYNTLRNKRFEYIFNNNATSMDASNQITNALKFLNYKVKNDMTQGTQYKNIEFYKPIILADGTMIIRTVTSEIPKQFNVAEIFHIITPDKKTSLLPITKNSPHYDLCRELLNNLSKVDGLKNYQYTEVHNQAINFREKMLSYEASIANDIKHFGLNTGNEFVHRTKGVSSLYDKMEGNYKKTQNMDEALKSVRDGVGTRTTLEEFDYKKYPELVALYKTNPIEASKKAAEMQSQYYVDKIIDIIKDPEKKLEITSISNYKGKNGLPYFSDAQIELIKDAAPRLNIKSGPDAIRGSGYTALQMNVKHKNGIISEWQLRGPKVNEFAEYEHIPYDLREGKDITSRTPELKEFYAPFEDMVKKMPQPMFERYLEFLTDHYHNLRLEELGLEGNYNPFPSGFDPRLSPDGLKKIHDEAEIIKNSLKNKK